MTLAEEDPEAFGMSVVTMGNWLYQYDDDGNMYTENDPDWYDKYTSTRPLYEMFESYLAVDFVDEGALTPNGLFSATLNKDMFAVLAAEFLSKHPSVDAFVKANPQKLAEFLAKRYGVELSLDFKSNNNTMSKPTSKTTKTENEAFDIQAGELTIVTEGEEAQVGDAVNDAEGNPAADGDHDITDGPLTGKTITVKAGVIDAINDTESDETEETEESAGTGEESPKGSVVTAEQFSAVQKQLTDLTSKFTALETENKNLRDELSKRPKSVFSKIVKKSDGLGQSQQKEETSYNKKAQAMYDKRNKK
jgi:hypothetical protein